MSRYTFEVNGERYTVDVESLQEDRYRVRVGENTYEVRFVPERDTSGPRETPVLPEKEPTTEEAGKRIVTAPMPGTVLSVDVQAGEKVDYGQPLLVLEAMKMKNHIRAPIEGIVLAVHVHPGEQVVYGTPLVELQGKTEKN